MRDTALLLASELVTNAILHAHTPVQVEILVDESGADDDDTGAVRVEGFGCRCA